MIDRSTTDCIFGTNYDNVKAAGALAFVHTVVWDPPGLQAFRHHTWNPSAHHKDMGVYCVLDPRRDLLETIRESTMPIATLAPPYNREWEMLYRSWAWIMWMQVVWPIFSFYTAYIAARGFFHDGWSNWNVRKVLYLVEAPTLVVFGVVFALGHLGPTILPLRFHNAMPFLANGASIFTTVLVALFLREEDRHLNTKTPRRPLWTQYRAILVVSALLFIVYDWALAVLFASDAYLLVPNLEVAFIVVWFLGMPVQVGVSVYFFKVARRMSGPLWFYLRPTEEGKSRYGSKAAGISRVGRLAFWLAVSGVCSIIFVVVNVVIVFRVLGLLRSPTIVVETFILLNISCFARIGGSLSQVWSPCHQPSPPCLCPKYRFWELGLTPRCLCLLTFVVVADRSCSGSQGCVSYSEQPCNARSVSGANLSAASISQRQRFLCGRRFSSGSCTRPPANF